MQYDIIHISGKPHVLVPLHDYTALTKQGDPDDTLPNDLQEKLALKEANPIKLVRKYRGLTQGELAEEAGISRPYLTEIETGRKEGSIRAIKALADCLDVPIDVLAA